jgi:hypothetical protein
MINITNIPLKSPTGKYRLKRPYEKFHSYVASENDKIIRDEDYLEWQISYYIDTETIYSFLRKGESLNELFAGTKSQNYIDSLNHCYKELLINQATRKLKKIFLEKMAELHKEQDEILVTVDENDKKKQFVLFELTYYLKEFYKKGSINRDNLEQIESFVHLNPTTIDDYLRVERESNKEIDEIFGFTLHFEKYPLLVKKFNEDIWIEIVKKHKQYALGYMNMVYLCFNARVLTDNGNSTIVGKDYDYVNEVNINIMDELVLETIKAFTLISHKHRNDIMAILKILKEL